MNTSYIPALLLLVISLAVSATAQLMPDDDMAQLAVIYPVGRSLEENYAAAAQSGFRIVRTGSFSNVLILAKDDITSVPAKLYDTGALLLLNPVIEGGCLLGSKRNTSAYKI